ncbi:Sensory box-containing diguanylate cyclase [Escherichia coli]|uniref:Sensory box-containing diguanylate cyclase n=1 Tax=Escherichia coli TaxID=562 RepID=A0A376VIL8_ECOLX|nr:Sensory box-containing diguanylate cyclase [Escherichia coli]
MITHNFNTLDLLTSPVWIVSPFEEQLIYANSAARLLMQDLTFSQLRTGPIPSPHKRTAKIPLRSAKPTRYYRNPHRSAQ